jgi:hypothetical protein
MRSYAGIVAGLFAIALVANCGGDDSGGTGTPTAGTSSTHAGEGGEGNSTSTAGSKNGGSTNGGSTVTPSAGEGGMATAACTKDAECGANAKCVKGECKKDDGQACTASAECQNACIDGMCTAKLPDDAACTSDDQCAHTCIDGKCAPPSPVGGDCDVDLGAGGAGGAGGAPAVGPLAAAGAGGDAGGLPPVNDCQAPLQCYAGKCLTPDGETCADNTDCLNTCVANVCKPKGTIDDKCDDTADCSSDKLVCDPTKKVCKLDVLSQCQTNAQCQSNRCLCSNHDCTVRTCKTADSSCQCRYSPTDAPSCDADSPVLDQKTADPNGCNSAKFCSAGSCISNAGGACTEPCTYHAATDNTPASCTSAGAPVGCNGGYHGNVTTQCYIPKGTTSCAAVCQCDLN